MTDGGDDAVHLVFEVVHLVAVLRERDGKSEMHANEKVWHP